MADESLNTTLDLRSGRIDATSFPPGSPMPFIEAITNRSDDVSSVADKAQQAASGAYEAQVKNDQQDVVLANHETRIQGLEIKVENHEVRITANTTAITALQVRVTTAEGNIVTLQANVTNLQGRMSTAETKITNLQTSVSAIQGDYVSKSATTTQTLLSPLSVSSSYSVNGVKVVGPRQTGWTASTGTANLGAFNADQGYNVSLTYVATDVRAIADGLIEARRRIKGIEDSIRNHGLIN